MNATPTSRAVLRIVDPGNRSTCSGCGQNITFSARERGRRQVVANVYVEGRWDRVEFWHMLCYLNGGQIYGQVT